MDKQIICKDCDRKFIFSVDEQKYFAEKGLANDPKRCPECRVVHRHTRAGKAIEDLADVICSECNRSTVVPFQRADMPLFIALGAWLSGASTRPGSAPNWKRFKMLVGKCGDGVIHIMDEIETVCKIPYDDVDSSDDEPNCPKCLHWEQKFLDWATIKEEKVSLKEEFKKDYWELFAKQAKSDRNAESLWAALANTIWSKPHAIDEEDVSFRWREASQFVAAMHGTSENNDWYCSSTPGLIMPWILRGLSSRGWYVRYSLQHG